MTHESLLNAGWLSTVDRLGGAEQLETEALVGAFGAPAKLNVPSISYASLWRIASAQWD